MANVVHSGLTAANLHEPKGVAAATVDKVYVSDGAGSGAWQKIESDQIDTTSIPNINTRTAYSYMADVSGTTASWVVLPHNCTVTNVYSVIYGAVATADNVVTVSNNAGSSMGTITIAFSGSAAGDVDTITTITTNNTFTAGQKIKFVSDGAGTNTVPCMFTVIYTVTS